MIALLAGLWRYGLVAALLAAAGIWHLTDKSKAVDDAVELVRAEYITAALAASESARSREQQLIKANEAGSRFKLIVTDGVFSMDGVGIVNASIKNVRMIVAAITAKMIASNHSRDLLFLPLLCQNFQFIIIIWFRN